MNDTAGKTRILFICRDSRTGKDIGSPVYPPARQELARHGISREGEEVADPWYTGDFTATWDDVLEGCMALLKRLKEL